MPLIPPAVYDDEIELRKWFDISYAYVSSLPKKKEKKKRIMAWKICHK
ncbi:hypothetical protein [Methanococcoides sp.]|jgi:hypothetical protein|nr:hypothetical protein [Methanococcoides sp.]